MRDRRRRVPVGLLGFVTVVLLAMLLLHGYLWWRLVRSTTGPGRLRRRLTLLTVVLALLPALAVVLRRTLPLDAAAPLDWVAYSWLGIAFYPSSRCWPSNPSG